MNTNPTPAQTRTRRPRRKTPPAVTALIAQLPAQVGDPWDEADRARWMAALSAVLEFCYPTPDAVIQKFHIEKPT